MIKESKIRYSNGKWIDSSVFRQEAIRFIEKGYYTEAPYGTPEWLDYWKEQLRRCLEGYEVSGEKITGHHYCYLNFAQIQKVEFSQEDEDGETLANKVVSFPDFWDGDYNFFWSLEIARNGLCSKYSQVPSTDKERKEWNKLNKELKGLEENSEEYNSVKDKRDKISKDILGRLNLFVKPHLDYLNGGYHFIVGKARRKGYSFKNALIIANIYNTVRDKLTLIGAYEKKFMAETMEKVWEFLNFFNEHTGFSKNRLVEKRDFIKSGFVEQINGVNVERGYKSRIDASRTFKDNFDAMRGVDALFILLEEAGVFDNLAQSFNATVPSLTAGSKITGQVCIIGTSGDMQGGTKDYADMFYNPLAYGLMPFINIWDENAENTVCGFFHPVTWNMEGFYDEQGNSNIKGAKGWEMKRRKTILSNSSSSALLHKHMQEFPLCPADAFSMSSHSIFPVDELRNRLNQIQAKSLHIKKGIPVTLHYNKDRTEVLAKPDLNNVLNPIYNYKPKTNDLTGAVVIYEFPSEKAPQNFYKIGYDPYRQNNGTSLSAITVFKGHLRGENTKYKIVAEYYGRPQDSDIVNEIALKLAMLYNTQVMFENEVTHPKTYFERKKALKYLAVQPDRAISNSIQNSKVDRKYGCHMTDRIKEDCEKYTNDWLLNGYEDDFGNTLSVIDEIDCPGFIEELLIYNRKVNCDRLSSFFMCMMQLQEQELEKEYSSSVSRLEEMVSFLNQINDRR
jgi:hypothetical protein